MTKVGREPKISWSLSKCFNHYTTKSTVLVVSFKLHLLHWVKHLNIMLCVLVSMSWLLLTKIYTEEWRRTIHTLRVIDIICKKLHEPCKHRLYQSFQDISIFIRINTRSVQSSKLEITLWVTLNRTNFLHESLWNHRSTINESTKKLVLHNNFYGDNYVEYFNSLKHLCVWGRTKR